MRTYLTPTATVASAFYTRNRLRSLSDYDAFQVANPLPGYEGQPITVYNLKREKLSAVDNVDTNVAEGNGSIYQGFVFSANARPPWGGSLFGGITIERNTNVFCDSTDNPNQFRFCDTSGGDGEDEALAQMANRGPSSGVRTTLPYQNSIKVGGDYPLPFGVQLSGAVRSVPGAERIITWSVPADGFDDGIVSIVADSTAWAKELKLLAARVVHRLNDELGHGTVLRIEVRGPQAPSWKKGPRTIRDARGPRDTYG